jgi:glutamate racemase
MEFALSLNNMKNNRKFSIGIFDSGFGGLQIMKHIVRELPEYDYVYLGDTARIPYGSRSQEVVFKFVKQAVEFLFNKDCQLIIFACNTASSKALRKIQQEYLPKYHPDRKVLGVIIPAAEEATCKNHNLIGVIATQGSVASNAFDYEIKKISPDAKVFQQACPLLVPIVESGEEKSKAADLMLEKYLKPLVKNNIDALILGCTHYGSLENKIRKIVGKDVKIINEGKVVAKKLKKYLANHPEIEKTLGKKSKLRFFTTDLTEGFEVMGSKFFGQKIKPEKINLE